MIVQGSAHICGKTGDIELKHIPFDLYFYDVINLYLPFFNKLLILTIKPLIEIGYHGNLTSWGLIFECQSLP